MHVLQPKHSKLKLQEAEKLLNQYNISPSQLPKIKVEDPSLPPDCKIGDIIKIERRVKDKEVIYYRVVV